MATPKIGEFLLVPRCDVRDIDLEKMIGQMQDYLAKFKAQGYSNIRFQVIDNVYLGSSTDYELVGYRMETQEEADDFAEYALRKRRAQKRFDELTKGRR